WEWPVNYKYGGVAFELHMIISAVGAAFYLILSVIAAAVSGPFGLVAAHHWYFIAALIGLLFVPFFVGMFFMWDHHRIVDGANDNLSGCYMGLTILRELKEKGIDLEHTEVGVIICGSEEAGLRGSKAWAEQHQEEFDDIPTYIYSYDTIHDPKWLMANYRDLNGTVKTDQELNNLFLKCAEELGIPCRKGWVPPLGGATDAAAFTQGGFRSGGITGLDHKLEDYYHTRRDTCDNMNPQGLADCYAISVKVLEKIENGAMDGR
ncbi:MAG: M20/M25/M40 family metallo-hydrolase, partial [Clostridia bacterium]|nr:M20/M25/M40 family metallo-hydrolase [Clostridia bacterium]